MIRVKTEVRESRVSGLGLYAAEYIPKGTITWQYDEKFDTSFLPEELNSLTPLQREWFMIYAYFDHARSRYVLCSDNQRHINHSLLPNIKSTPDFDTASQDITIGEEMTCDYTGYEVDWFERRGVDKADFSS